MKKTLNTPVHHEQFMRATATFLVAFVSALIFTGCATTPKPTAADNAFDEFHARMIANYPSASAAQALRPTANETVTETNQSRFALPLTGRVGVKHRRSTGWL